jgi:alkylated DNA repair dioxygenase AlkB
VGPVTAATVVGPDPSATVERIWLDHTSWVDVVRGWVSGAPELYDALAEGTAWRQGRLWRYERWVEEPRLGGWWRPGQPAPHVALGDLHRAVQSRYRVHFDGVALALYRDGRDSVAFHRDRELRWLDDTVIAVLTLGATRPWLLRPRSRRYDHEAPHRGASHDLAPRSGDLLVMGGRCQADWEHAVPKVAGRPGGRISLQWRWTARTGRPEAGASYRAPRAFSR